MSGRSARARFAPRYDLVTMADALAMSRRDEAALEVAGMAEALGDDQGIPRGKQWHIQGRDQVAKAAERLGQTAVERAQ